MKQARWSVLMVLLLLLSATAYAWPEPDYTDVPQFYREYQAFQRMAGWILEAWQNPTEVMTAQVEKVAEWNAAGRPDDETPEAMRYLGLQDYMVSRRAVQGDSAIRGMLAGVLVENARWDPVFAAILEVARPHSENRVEAIQAMRVLVDALNTLEGDHHGAWQAASAIVVEKMEDGRAGVRFMAINGIVALPDAYRTEQMTQLLISEVAGDEDILIAQAARSLAEIGAVEAVRPLMEKFMALEEGDDPATPAEEETATEPINQTRLILADAVERLISLDLAVKRQPDRASLMARYQELEDWWDANQSQYN